ncbi:hypothetical protein [Actinoallomurus sp. NPDC050550]|uniref:hypothetical protein n=1 Tax=Actinoallomurus sp. NPDC050550 TaxID=3154937 RepID=UPI0033C1D350
MSLSRRLPAGGPALATAGTAFAVAATSSSAAAPARPRTREPIVIAHRGAGAYRPEDTMNAYRPAVEMGAAAQFS